jgi:hypothetical protein
MSALDIPTLLKVLIPNKWSSTLSHPVKVNGMEVPWNWENMNPGTDVRWTAGNRIDLSENGHLMEWTAFTVGSGRIQFLWRGTFTRLVTDGEWKWSGNGEANCFAMGIMPLDAGYIQEYLAEMYDTYPDGIPWQSE